MLTDGLIKTRYYSAEFPLYVFTQKPPPPNANFTPTVLYFSCWFNRKSRSIAMVKPVGLVVEALTVTRIYSRYSCPLWLFTLTLRLQDPTLPLFDIFSFFLSGITLEHSASYIQVALFMVAEEDLERQLCSASMYNTVWHRQLIKILAIFSRYSGGGGGGNDGPGSQTSDHHS